jgi:beta-xylosidase
LYYLFYSGNAYYNGSYAVGVARAASPLGPYLKLGSNPILKTGGYWVGPGHCSVLDGPSGDTYMVYHAWLLGHVNGPGDGRMDLVDQIQWRGDGWPQMLDAPSAGSRPLP